MFYSKSTGGFYDPEIHGTNIPPDARKITREQYQTLLDGQASGKRIDGDIDGLPVLVAPPPPSPAQVEASFTAAIQQRLDDFASTRSYDSAVSMSKYAQLTDDEINSLPQADQSAVFRYRAECRYFLLKVAQTWAVCERILAQVQAGTRPMPASIADIEADLPALVWPA